ncbi:MAG: hypothetical protein ACI8P9_004145, partial [Parasphingorhabdus sp.]
MTQSQIVESTPPQGITTVDIKKLEASYKETINPRASLGFLGLATDRAGFKDFCDFVSPVKGIEVFNTRIPFVETATP